jgi:hypothetical protein
MDIDNVVATVIPAPAALRAGVGLLAVIGLRRRSRRRRTA